MSGIKITTGTVKDNKGNIIPIRCSRKEYKARYGKETLDNTLEEQAYQVSKKAESKFLRTIQQNRQLAHIQHVGSKQIKHYN